MTTGKIEPPIKRKLSALGEPEVLTTAITVVRASVSPNAGSFRLMGGSISLSSPECVGWCDRSSVSSDTALEPRYLPGGVDNTAISAILTTGEVVRIHDTQHSSVQLPSPDRRRQMLIWELLLLRRSAEKRIHVVVARDASVNPDGVEDTDTARTSTSETSVREMQRVGPGKLHGIDVEDHASYTKHDERLVPSAPKRSVLGSIRSGLRVAHSVLIDISGNDTVDVCESRAHLIEVLAT